MSIESYNANYPSPPSPPPPPPAPADEAAFVQVARARGGAPEGELLAYSSRGPASDPVESAAAPEGSEADLDGLLDAAVPPNQPATAGAGGFSTLNAQYPEDNRAFVTAAYHEILGRCDEATAAAANQPATLSEAEIAVGLQNIELMTQVRANGGDLNGVHYEPRPLNIARDEARKEAIASMVNSPEAAHHAGFAESGLVHGIPVGITGPDGSTQPLMWQSQALQSGSSSPSTYKGAPLPLDEPLNFDHGMDFFAQYFNNGTSKNPLAQLQGSVGEASDAAAYRMYSGSPAFQELAQLGEMTFGDMYYGWNGKTADHGAHEGNGVLALGESDQYPELNVDLNQVVPGRAGQGLPNKIRNEADMMGYMQARHDQMTGLIAKMDPAVDPPSSFDAAREALQVVDAALAFGKQTEHGGTAVLLHSVPEASVGWYPGRASGAGDRLSDDVPAGDAQQPKWKQISDYYAYEAAARAAEDPDSFYANWKQRWLR
ncbi:MAG: hypothetical protein JWM80_308 [Cyanobacteria bacterium RYN_339]|nr:hypothetical protein [Cyanobacteria bacterium RYN_339]